MFVLYPGLIHMEIMTFDPVNPRNTAMWDASSDESMMKWRPLLSEYNNII